MASNRIKIRMNSTGKKKNGQRTGYFKTTTKQSRDQNKLCKKYYDPRAWDPKKNSYGMHVEFKEGKIK